MWTANIGTFLVEFLSFSFILASVKALLVKDTRCCFEEKHTWLATQRPPDLEQRDTFISDAKRPSAADCFPGQHMGRSANSHTYCDGVLCSISPLCVDF